MSLTAVAFADQRRHQLYGPGRALNEGHTVKSMMTKTSILKDGEYNFKSENLKDGVFNSVTKIDYKGQMPEQTGLLYNDRNLQLKQHFELGNDSGKLVPDHTYKLSETKETYTRKEHDKPYVHKLDSTVNWPDMAPQYMTQSFMKNSEYDSAFKADQMLNGPKGPSFPKINTSQLQLPLANPNQLKWGTSITFGNDHRRLETEAGYSYNQMSDFKSKRPGSSSLSEKLEQTRQITQMMKTMERNSNVFRNGDYNDAKQSMASTFAVDYSRKNHIPASIKLPDMEGNIEQLNEKIPRLVEHAMHTSAAFGQATQGKKYHTTAHFDLGNHGDTHKSVYHKDYLPQQNVEKQHAHRPVDSKVLQRDEGADFGKTSTDVFFSKKPTEMANLMNPDKDKAMRENMARRHGNNVVLSYDPKWHLSERQTSLTHDTYQGPPETYKAMQPLKAEDTPFNFLHTDGATNHPPGHKTTEVQDNYKGYGLAPGEAVGRIHRRNDISKSRVEDGKNAHFVFGDDPKEFKTEQKTEFSGRPKMDQKIPYAGKTEIVPKYKWTHVNISENTEDFKPDPHRTSTMESIVARDWYVTRSLPSLPVHKASTMKTDYTPLENRDLTDPQKRMIEASKRLTKPVEKSHYFHTDTSNRNNWQTTNKFDFIKPEVMSGKIYLEAR